MFKKTRKFSELSRSQKLHIIAFLLFISFIPTKYFLEWRGRDFPQKSALNYSTGVLEYFRAPGKRSKAFTVLKSLDQDGQKTFYGCSYTAVISSSSSSCMGLERMKPYLGKYATVGWYYQPSFLGFQNNVPQLVSLKVDGKYVRTYEETVEMNDRSHILLAIISLIFTIFFTLLFVFLIYPNDSLSNEK